jgi:hypothetical protein
MSYALLVCASCLIAVGCSPRHALVAFPSDDGPPLPATAAASVRVVPSGVAGRAGCRPLGWVAANVTVPTVFGNDDAILEIRETGSRLGASELRDVRIDKEDDGHLIVTGLAVACPRTSAP